MSNLYDDIDKLGKKTEEKHEHRKAVEEAAKKTKQEKAKAIKRHEEDKRQGMI